MTHWGYLRTKATTARRAADLRATDGCVENDKEARIEGKQKEKTRETRREDSRTHLDLPALRMFKASCPIHARNVRGECLAACRIPRLAARERAIKGK